LIDKEFDLVTDHSALKSLLTRKIDQNRLVRHQMLMQPYQYRIVYKPGRLHPAPDAFSRLPNLSGEITEDTYADQIPVCEATTCVKGNEKSGGAKQHEADAMWARVVSASFDDVAEESVPASAAAACVSIECGGLVVLGFALDQRKEQDDAQVMPCKLITREKEEKLKMDPKLCLRV